MQLTSAILDRTDLKRQHAIKGHSTNVLGTLELNEARAREENECLEKHTFGLQDLETLTQTHAPGLWIEKEYRK